MARLLLKDLTPGTTYKIQVRSKTGDSVSEWSRLFDLPTTTDNTPPDVPAWAPSDEWVTSGDTFVATWQPLDFNLDHNKDFSHYEVRITNGTTAFVIRTTNTSYTLTFEQNRIYWGTPQSSLQAQVRAVDLVGNTSAFNSLESATNPAPSAPASIAVTALYDSVKIDWEPVADDDLKGYKLQVSTTSSSAGFSDIYNGPDLSYVHSTVAFLTDHWYRIYAVDKFGTLSTAVTSGAVKPKSTFSTDGTAPDAPPSATVTPGFNASRQTAFIDVAWTASPSSDETEYEIRYGTATSGEWQYIRVAADVLGTRLDDLVPGTNYYVSVRAIDAAQNKSAFTDASTYPVTTTNDTSAPSQPAAPSAAVGTQKLQVTISGDKQSGGAMESDVARYQVFASSTSGFTPGPTNMLGTVEQGPAMVETFQIPASSVVVDAVSQNWYVVVKAVDRAGNVSTASPETTAAVGLILTANIADANITNAKIQTMTASKITTGTISANTITLGASGNMIVDSTGIIRTNNWTPNSTGYRLTSTSFELNQGTIYTGGLVIRDGKNLMPNDYESFEKDNVATPYVFYKTGGAGNTGAEQTTTIAQGGSTYGYQHLRNQWTTTTGNPQTIWMTPALGTYNINVESGLSYIISAYFWNTGGVNTNVQLGIAWATSSNTFISSSLPPTASTTVAAGTTVGSATRVSGVVSAPANATKAVVFVTSSTTTNGAGFNLDAIQVEVQAGGVLTPSIWKASGATTIDGGIIRTSEVRSADNLTINGITLPYWSINTNGDALFSNMFVRGNAILGGALEDADSTMAGAGSLIQSYNYKPGLEGWAISSNGWAEFRSVAVGFPGGSIEEGTLSAKSLQSESLLTGTIIASGGGGIHSRGDMGEDVGLDGEGFTVYGPYKSSVINKSLTGGVATLTTASNHGFSDVADSNGLKNKLFIQGVGDPFDGTWRISSITSNTVSYTIEGGPADVASTAVFGGIAMSKSTIDNRDLLIEFPTDGSSPNIISGQLNASTLNVATSTTLRGATTVENGVMTITSGVTQPTNAPTVANTYQTLPLSGSDFSFSYGMDKGHNGNIFVLCKDDTNIYVKEFNSTTGVYVQTVLTQPITDTTSAYPFTTDHSYNPRGIVYHPTHNKYYIYLTDIYTRTGGRPIPGAPPPEPDRSEDIRTYDTSFTLLDNYSSNFDTGNDAGWVGGSLGRDYTVTNKLVRTMMVSTSLRYLDVTLDGTTGLPTTTAAAVVLNGTTSANNQPAVSMRVNDLDNVSATRLITKDRRGSGSGLSTIITRWSPFNGANVVTTEQWEAANNSITMGAFYDTTEKVVYALTYAGVVKYESLDSNFSSSTMESQRWIGYSWYDSVAIATYSVDQKSATTTTATVRTTINHGLTEPTALDQWIEIRGVDSRFNGHHQITDIPSANEITFASTGSALSATTVSPQGSLKTGTYETQLSPIRSHLLKKRARMSVTINAIPYMAGEYPNQAKIYTAAGSTMPTLTGTVSSAWHLRETLTYPSTVAVVAPVATPSGDTPLNTVTNTFSSVNAPSMIKSTTGNSYWKGDDSAQFYQLILKSSADVTTSAGNRPPLIIGNYTPGGTIGAHMRLDGNEIAAMTNDSTQGALILNTGGQTNVSDIQIVGNVIGSVNGTGTLVMGSIRGTASVIDLSYSGGGNSAADINNAGRIVRNTSSIRYKENVEAISIEEARKALNLESVSFHLKEEAGVPNRRRYPGFIAEQAHDSELYLWVNMNSSGQPEGFRYAELTAAHNMLIKELYDEIAALKAQLA